MPPSVIKDPKFQLKGHTYWCRYVVWSPDGDLLATASADNFLRVFQCDGTEAFKVKHPDWVWACDFSFTAKRRRLATACLKGKVRIFDATNGRELLTIQAHGDKTVNCVALSPNGEHVLSGGYDQAARIFNVGNGKETRCFDDFEGPVLSVLWTGDSVHAVAGSSTGELVFFDASSGKEVKRINKAHTGRVNGMAISTDGKLLATAGGDKLAKVWDLGASGFAGGNCKLITSLKLADEEGIDH